MRASASIELKASILLLAAVAVMLPLACSAQLPNLALKAYVANGGAPVYPGMEGVMLLVVLQNVGSEHLTNVVGKLDLSGTPFTTPMGKVGYSAFGGVVQPGRLVNLFYNLSVSSDARPGSYTATLSVSYQTTSGRPVAEEFTLELKVGIEAGRLVVSITQASVRPGEEGTMLVKLTNPGDKPIYSISVSASPLTSFRREELPLVEEPVYVPSPSPIALKGHVSYFIRELPAGASATLVFRFVVSLDAKEGTYPLYVTVSYTSSSEVAESYVAGITVLKPIKQPEEQEPQKPILSVSSVDVRPEPVRPGGEFELEVSLENLGEAPALEVKLEYAEETEQQTEVDITSLLTGAQPQTPQQPQRAFLPSGPPAVILKEVQPGESVLLAMKLIADLALEEGVYPVQLKLEYKDPLGNTYESPITIGVRVVKEPSLKIYAVSLSRLSESRAELTGTVANVGQGKAQGVALDVYCNGRVYTYYIGELEAGESEDFLLTVEVPSASEVEVEIKMLYTDTQGREIQSTYHKSLTVPPAEAEAKSKGSSMKLLYLTAIAVAAAMVLLLIRGRKVSRRITPHYEPAEPEALAALGGGGARAASDTD